MDSQEIKQGAIETREATDVCRLTGTLNWTLELLSKDQSGRVFFRCHSGDNVKNELEMAFRFIQEDSRCTYLNVELTKYALVNFRITLIETHCNSSV